MDQAQWPPEQTGVEGEPGAMGNGSDPNLYMLFLVRRPSLEVKHKASVPGHLQCCTVCRLDVHVAITSMVCGGAAASDIL